MRARVAPREGVSFQTQTGRRLSYGKLAVVDTRGRWLAAQLQVPEASRVRFLVEDRAAAYPLVIDPLLGRQSDRPGL